MCDRLVLTVLIALGWASIAVAQPVPPVFVPPEFQGDHEGYDMAVPYQRWRMWIEAQKGPVTEQALAEPDAVDGLHRIGQPLFTVAFHNDQGRAASGDVQVFCTAMPTYPAMNRGECSYIYRRADVPIEASYSGAPNAFDVWMRDNFDPALIVRNLRAAQATPATDLWMLRNQMFEGAPSPASMLAGHLRIVRVDSRECPAFKTAVEAVERRRLDWTLDLFAVGEDQPPIAPRPHAGRTFYTLNAWVGGHDVTLSGGPAMAEILGPVIEAVYACEVAEQRRRVRSRS